MGWDLHERITHHHIPGAQLAVLANGEIHDEAAGVLSLRTRVEATTDSVFKIGSITKIWTATLIQHLVTDGALDLDRPVRHYLPGFRLSDPAATAALTARHLLTHTGGVDGHHLVDTGRNDDAIERFVATLADADHLFPPGELFSYTNNGYVVLGRLVEVLRGRPFHDVLRGSLVAPIGLSTVATTTYEALLHRTAVGHVEADGQLSPAKTWATRAFSTPSGSHLAMSARDLLTFVRRHLADPELAALREPQPVDVPDFGGGIVGWGVGWMRYRDAVVGHTGVSQGQKAFLRVAPAAGVAVAVLTNSAGGEPLAYDLFATVLRDLAGVTTTPQPRPPAHPTPIDADRLCGTYRTTLHDFTLTVENGRAYLTRRSRADAAKTERAEVVGLGDSAVITAEPKLGGHQVFSFVGSDEQGRARYLHNGSAARRTTPADPRHYGSRQPTIRSANSP
ncbi:serine hydrolase domain-containing protein [Amycolatopsis rhabdoformis]|uniref:Serine hydrolase domain-containing protein n=1 Tax=Amycolatopsis rhabdoformis TaxID=1448059 RepID=A0ABZ1IAH0_9PSEU|nr:serine hydrolase domain-containing protein [Amycolatopsis rhabdoformis]WSE30430.1 serine hydrolase domain-containing protein [Amycolatopsis rhabdoformis]